MENGGVDRKDDDKEKYVNYMNDILPKDSTGMGVDNKYNGVENPIRIKYEHDGSSEHDAVEKTDGEAKNEVKEEQSDGKKSSCSSKKKNKPTTKGGKVAKVKPK